MKMPWTSLIENISGLASEFIEDPDKRNELMFKVKELEFSLRETLLTTKTNTWVDGFVKILIAFRDIILPMLRPVGAFCMTAFGLYCHAKGIDIDGATHAMIDGAFPAWGASRHVNKNKEQEEKTKQIKAQSRPWYEDPIE